MQKMQFLAKKTFTVFFCLCLGIASECYGATPSTSVKTVTDTVTAQQHTLTEGQKWEQEQVKLSQEIRQAKLESEWFNLHIQTLERYIGTAEKNVAKLQRMKMGLERLENLLETKLVEIVAQFGKFIQNDMPFLIQERQARAKFLQNSLDDYDLGLEEKLRRVFEALQVEGDYAKNFEITDETIDTPTGKHKVQLTRIGRVGLFALAPDGTKAWQYTSQGYKEMPAQYLPALQALQKESIQQLPMLPFVEVK